MIQVVPVFLLLGLVSLCSLTASIYFKQIRLKDVLNIRFAFWYPFNLFLSSIFLFVSLVIAGLFTKSGQLVFNLVFIGSLVLFGALYLLLRRKPLNALGLLSCVTMPPVYAILPSISKAK